jgi:DNA-binding transcriptional ArsR family regulator
VAVTEPGTTPARITDLRQIRAIADPLRIRMLQLFAQGPLTTKQVADRLGEKPTRLYNHARTLERAGLVRLVRTARNRGTTERYLEAVAPGFEVDESLFAMGRSGSSARAAVYATASAMLRGVAARLETATDTPGAEPLVGQAAVIVTPREYDWLHARVLQWVESLQRRKPGRGRRSDAGEALLTIALLPPASAAGAASGSRSPAGRSGRRGSRARPRSGDRPPR